MAIRWIFSEHSTGINGVQRMNPNDFADPLISLHYWMDSQKIWFQHLHFPQNES